MSFYPGVIMRVVRSICVVSFFFSLYLMQIKVVLGSTDSIISEIKEYKVKNGHAMTDIALFNLLERYRATTTDELMSIWTVFGNVQSPSVITKSNLKKIFATKMNSISSTKQIFTYCENIRGTEQKKLVNYCTFENMSYVELPDTIKSYDGDVVRIVMEHESDKPFASVSAGYKPIEFFQFYSPVALGMLINTKSAIDRQLLDFDCLSFLEYNHVVVLSQMEKYQGFDCIIVTDGYLRVYLAPKLDYSVVGYETYSSDKPDGIGVFFASSRQLTSRRICADFREYDNGLWFPQNIRITYYERGKEYGNVEVTVDSLEMNTTIDKQLFSDIIPDWAFVSDSVIGITYMQSDSPSINSLLKETVKSKRVWIFKYISMSLGLAMIVFALVAKYFAYRKRKNDV